MHQHINPQARFFVLVSIDEWLAIADCLAKPWPPEAVRMELAICAALPSKNDKLFGRTACMARWGWTQKQVRSAFEGHGPAARR